MVAKQRRAEALRRAREIKQRETERVARIASASETIFLAQERIGAQEQEIVNAIEELLAVGYKQRDIISNFGVTRNDIKKAQALLDKANEDEHEDEQGDEEDGREENEQDQVQDENAEPEETEEAIPAVEIA